MPCRRFAAPVVTALVALGCNAGAAATPALEEGGTPADAGHDATASESGPDAGSDAATDAGSDAGTVSYDICPDGMAPSFPSIFTQLLSTGSCGTGSFYCHSSIAALPQAEGGTGSLLDLSLDASAVYAELLGPDGGGYPATNVAGDAGEVVLRVAPGDAGASLLYIKLALTTLRDPRYGMAMPPAQTVCPTAIEAVKAWIDDGAAPR
jgi:hypothetical protein